MRRLIRNIHGEPRPLIMHPRLRWLVKLDSKGRALWALVTRTRYKGPRYMRPLMSAEERAQQREAVRCLIGGRSPNPVVARYYRERSRLALLASDNVSESRKQEMRAAGPLCSPEDEAEVLANRAKKARAQA